MLNVWQGASSSREPRGGSLMAHRQPHTQRQQMTQRCTICMLFQSMGRGQYRSSYDREMYLHHLQTAHGVKLSEDQGEGTRAKGAVLKA